MRRCLGAMALGLAISSQLLAQHNTYSIPCRVFAYRLETPSGEFDRAMVAWLFD
jgi:hypothetical protein